MDFNKLIQTAGKQLIIISRDRCAKHPSGALHFSPVDISKSFHHQQIKVAELVWMENIVC
jgi:hypothetical protein